MWPLPGGVDGYQDAVRRMLNAAKDRPPKAEFERRVFELFPTVESESTVRGYAGVLVALGFVERNRDGRVVVTTTGKRFARTGDAKVLRQALVSRVYGAREVLEVIADHTMAYPEVQQELRQRGIEWGNAMAVRYRIWWLRAAGAIDAERRMRADWLTLTRAGRALLHS